MAETLWGGSLGELLDGATNLPVQVRAFGSFVSEMDDPGLRQVLLDAVRVAAMTHAQQHGVGQASADVAAVAVAAMALLAARGVVGQLSIAALSIDPDDHARLTAAAAAAAAARRP